MFKDQMIGNRRSPDNGQDEELQLSVVDATMLRPMCVPTVPSDKAKEDESLIPPRPSPRCDRWRATTPVPPVYIDRCSSLCCELVSLTASSCGFLGFLPLAHCPSI